jgi:RimJ/RimL family protein N-acetyltransferase
VAATGSGTPAALLTERLLLRPLTADDARALLRFRGFREPRLCRAPGQQGLGLGREAAGALVEWLFSGRGTRTIFAGVYEPNLPSRRLLESLGFRKDRFFPVTGVTAGKQLPSWRYRLDRD